MVEDMYQQESKEEAEVEEQEHDHEQDDDEDQERETSTDPLSQTPKSETDHSGNKRSEINAPDSDPSRRVTISRQRFSENQADQASAMANVAPPAYRDPDTCPGIGIEYGTTSAAAAAAAADTTGSTLIRFGTTSGDVSLTLGLRHAGNVPEKNPFSVRGFGGF